MSEKVTKEQARKMEELIFSKKAGNKLANDGMKLFDKISKIIVEEETDVQLAFLTLSSMAEAIMAFYLVNDKENLTYEDFYHNGKED